ncbi:hypothetical protein P6U16_09570 [Rhizobium sp. 32-5/1]|uniref:hypothetical protein n=1 Tax=Rhizobium sp. 32-5/1 TaxID=3019602 RepID=UPI00240D2F57|nr:hypothetical protein [Rhizobium sp. 32-5/1]WEZ84771.1 hypothetical protein P6U16_09570 [Rhizobium sp. 32-5/1]
MKSIFVSIVLSAFMLFPRRRPTVFLLPDAPPRTRLYGSGSLLQSRIRRQFRQFFEVSAKARQPVGSASRKNTRKAKTGNRPWPCSKGKAAEDFRNKTLLSSQNRFLFRQKHRPKESIAAVKKAATSNK